LVFLISRQLQQINALVVCPGSVPVLYYSNRIMHTPLAIYGFSFASVSLSAMSKFFAQKDMTMLKSSLNYSIRLTVFALLPAAVGLMVIGLPIVKLLFEHGNFSASGSIMTNNALFYYSLGLPAYALSKIFANVFYSFQDTEMPVKTAVGAMILHIVLCVILMRPMGVGGLALATTVSSYFNLILLVVYLKKRIGELGLKQILFLSLKSLLAAILTGITSWNMCKISDNLIIAVPIATISGFIVFITVPYILNIDSLKVEPLKIFLSIFSKHKNLIKDKLNLGLS